MFQGSSGLVRARQSWTEPRCSSPRRWRWWGIPFTASVSALLVDWPLFEVQTPRVHRPVDSRASGADVPRWIWMPGGSVSHVTGVASEQPRGRRRPKFNRRRSGTGQGQPTSRRVHDRRQRRPTNTSCPSSTSSTRSSVCCGTLACFHERRPGDDCMHCGVCHSQRGRLHTVHVCTWQPTQLQASTPVVEKLPALSQQSAYCTDPEIYPTCSPSTQKGTTSYADGTFNLR